MAERPLLHGHLTFVWGAFNVLSGDRVFDMGSPGSIPFVAIDRFAERYGMDDIDEFDVFLSHIKAMDRVWKDHVMAQQKKADGKPR